MTHPLAPASSPGNGLSALEEEELVETLKGIRPSIPTQDKIHSWALLMARASQEATEDSLRQLKPASPGEIPSMKWTLAMEEAAGPVIHRSDEKRIPEDHAPVIPVKSGFSFKRRMTYAAAALLALTMGILAFLYNSPEKNSMAATGDLNRQAVRVVPQGVNWNKEKGIAERQFRVDFEDTIELRDKNGNRISVSVPSSRTVVVPVETY